MRPGFCSVALTCAPAVLVRRQGKARSGIESWAGRYPQAADHRRDGARELGKPQASRAGFMAGSDAGEETADAGGDRPGEQDGPENLGDADETGRVSRSGGGCGGVTLC